jgi:hypothetical protein
MSVHAGLYTHSPNSSERNFLALGGYIGVTLTAFLDLYMTQTKY